MAVERRVDLLRHGRNVQRTIEKLLDGFRHPLRFPQHVVVFQVPTAEPLRGVQRSAAECDRMHAEGDYAGPGARRLASIIREEVKAACRGS